LFVLIIAMSEDHTTESIQTEESPQITESIQTEESTQITESIQTEESTQITESIQTEESTQITESTNIPTIPKIIFIVPYRDRKEHLDHFQSHMKIILEDYEPGSFKFIFAHQCDKRTFNRGAMKNIGFIAVKTMYPNDYKKITLVFNDVDCMPVRKNLINYETVVGVIKHFYGFTYTLGGIFSITGADFEKLNGFPNFWGWGYEDNMMQKRAEKGRLIIDRSNFFNINDIGNIIQLMHGVTRDMNKTDFEKFATNTNDGINNISALNYTVDIKTNFINITNFTTSYEEQKTETFRYDVRRGNRPIVFNARKNSKATMLMKLN
jgi:hypothetical protein